MGYVFLVVAHDDRGVHSDMSIAAYDNQQAAEDHAKFIDGVDNEFTASVKFMHLHKAFSDDNNIGMRDIAYFEGQPPNNSSILPAVSLKKIQNGTYKPWTCSLYRVIWGYEADGQGSGDAGHRKRAGARFPGE